MKATITTDTTAHAPNGLAEKQVGPYMGIQFDAILNFGNDKVFRVLISQAYNAFGLIGPEHNGIVVLDENKTSVLLDRHLEQSTGYFGASKQQIDFVRSLLTMTWKDFKAFVNSNPRARYSI